LIAFALRLPWRWYALPLLVLAFCLFLYLYALPGDQSVRNVLSFHPIDSALVAADWISSPWTRGWLGFADPPLDPSSASGLPYQHLGAQLQASAIWVQSASGLSWRMLSRLLGVLGIILFLARFARLAFDRRTPPTRLEVLASTLCLFALATAAVIGMGRLDYFRTYPEEVYADRYLVWPSLFWTGLALLLVAQTRSAFGRKLSSVCIAASAVLPMALLPTQQESATWGSIVYRSSQQIAAVARSGIFDPAIFPDGDDAHREDVLRSLALFKQRRMAMFADPAFERIDTVWSASLSSSSQIVANAHLYNFFDDPLTGMHAAHFEGLVSQGIAQIQRSGQLAVLDEENRVVGLAEFSYIPGDQALMTRVPRKRGFDGYIRDYKSDMHYRLIVLPRDDRPALDICQIGPPLAPQ
jgi:hypothetical protein